MPNEAESVAALFRRALKPRPDALAAEGRTVQKLVRRAIERQERRQVRQTLRTVFARLVVELAEAGWTRGGDGVCAECACERPPYPVRSKRRLHYVTCPRGHRLHIECLRLRAVDGALGFDAACPRCLAP